MRNILPHDGTAYLYSDFYSDIESRTLFLELERKIEWQHQSIKIFGKMIKQPRLSAWYGEPEARYTYSGLSLTPKAWTKTLVGIKNKLESRLGERFNSVLLNLYRDGNDSMGWHQDDEKELGRNPVIASLSFGVTRKFIFRNCLDPSEKVSIELTSGSLLLMKGKTQHRWSHALPKSKKIFDPRINLTFRQIF